jgi:Zn-dependent metalloprotease
MLDSLHEVVFDEVDSTGIFFPQPNTLNSGEVLALYDEVFYEDDNNSAVKIDEWQDSLLGYTHIKYQQYYGDYLVEGAQFIEHSDNGKVEFINGKVGEITPDHFSDGRLSKEQAWNRLQDSLRLDTHTLAYQIQEHEDQLKLDTDNPDATYHPTANAELLLALKNWRGLTYLIPAEKYALAWKFKVLSLSPYYYKAYYVDATTGDVIRDNNLTHENTTASIWYHGDQLLDTDWRGFPHNNHRLLAQDNTRNFETKYAGRAYDVVGDEVNWNLIKSIKNNNSYWGTNEHDATAAHWFVQRSWDYFKNEHQRIGVNGYGSKLRVIPDATTGNAKYWPPANGNNSRYIELGSYNGAEFGRAIDVVAHEFAHGVIESTADLQSSAESGALSESFADIFGYLVEYYAEGASATLSIGDDLPGLPSRSLDDPKSDGYHPNQNCNGNLPGQPDTYMGTYWSMCGTYDDGGIHTNSGVQNKWFSLLVQGGTGINDNNHSYYISPITTEHVGKIVYYTVRNLLDNSSQYVDSRARTILAAKTIYGSALQNISRFKMPGMPWELVFLQPVAKLPARASSKK